MHVATPKLPHVVDGVLDFQSVRLAYCEQAALLKAGQTELSMNTCRRMCTIPLFVDCASVCILFLSVPFCFVDCDSF